MIDIIGYRVIKSIIKKLVKYLKAIFFLLKISFLLWFIKDIQKVIIISKMNNKVKNESNIMVNKFFISKAKIGKNSIK